MWVDESGNIQGDTSEGAAMPRPSLVEQQRRLAETGKEIALAVIRLEVEIARTLWSLVPKPSRTPGQGW